MFLSMRYITILLPAIILALYAQAKVNSTFQKYARVRNMRGYTGADVARELLKLSGIYDVRVEQVAGNLTDHYDPRSKVLRLSESVYNSNSISAVGVAAHETGHAIQDATGYAFLRLRSAMVPVTQIGSNLAMPMIFIGVLLGGFTQYSFGYTLVQIGIVFFAIAVLFSLVTLPVEFNASNRAIAMLESNGFLESQEVGSARKVLNAAALTYVAAAAVAIANLLRLLAIFGRRND